MNQLMLVAPHQPQHAQRLDRQPVHSHQNNSRPGELSRQRGAHPARRTRNALWWRIAIAVLLTLGVTSFATPTSATSQPQATTSKAQHPPGPLGSATHGSSTGTGVERRGSASAPPPVSPNATPPTSATTSATQTLSTQTTATTSSGWGLPNPTQWVQQVLATALTAFFSGVLLALTSILNWAQGVGGSAFNFITRTPPEGTYKSASVVTLWKWVVGVADAALAILLLWGGYAAMSREALGTRALGALQLLPRLGLAALAANLSLLFASSFIDVGNALCDGVGQVGLPGYSAATAAQQALATIVLAVVYCVVGFLLIAQMLLRLALLDVLIVTAPLGFLCWALPQTQAWARLWTSTFLATALVQFLQILALRLGALLVNELAPGRLDSATLTLLVGIATLYLTFKLPSMLQNWALRSVGSASMSGVMEQGMAVASAIGTVASAAFA